MSTSWSGAEVLRGGLASTEQGVDLDAHIVFVVQALTGVAADIGLTAA